MLLLSPVHTNTMTDKCLPFAFIAHILHAETNGTGSLGASAAEGKMHIFYFTICCGWIRAECRPAAMKYSIRYKLHVAAWEGVASHTREEKLHITSKKICLSHRFV